MGIIIQFMYFISLYALQENIADVNIHVYLVYNTSQLQKYINVYVILCNNVCFSYNYSGYEVILQYVNAKMLAIFF